MHLPRGRGIGGGHNLRLVTSDMTMRMDMAVHMTMAVRMTVRMDVCAALTSVMPQPQATSQAGDDNARHTPKPWVEALRDDVVRQQQRRRTKEVHPCGVGHRHDQTQVQRMPEGATGADEIGGDDRFTVAWLECMQSAKSDGDGQGETRHPKAKLLSWDEISQDAARGRYG